MNRGINKRIKLLSGIAAALMFAVSVIGCKHNVNNKPETFTVTFGVEGVGGTLKATVDGSEINSGNKVEHGKTVTFTATPDAGYTVKEWKADGSAVTGSTSNTYTCTVTKALTVKVSFLAGGASYTVKHYQEKAEGGYPAEPAETENLTGTVGTNAAYTPKTGGAYEGFTCNSSLTKVNGRLTQTGTVLADGNTVVELFYERNTVSLTFHLAGGNIEGKTDDIVKTGKYGTPFTAPAEPAKATGIFKGWKPALPSPLLFPASNAEHTAEWTPKALLTLEAGKNTVKVKAKTADGSAIKVEGCSVNELASDVETTLTVTDSERKLALIGDIIELDCRGEETPGGNRPLIALDVSGLTALQKLDCRFNKITELDVQGLKDLQELYCNSNTLTALDVHGLTKLEKLYCNSNELSTLDVSGLTKLQELYCKANQLTALNVQDSTKLQQLDCSVNKLSTLNVQGLNALQKLDCYRNKLTELNVQGCTSLQKLLCENNDTITALNVQGCTSLQELRCPNAQLATLDVQGLTALQQLECYGNQLTTLNVQGCTSLQKLNCEINQLATLNVQGCTSLKILLCDQNKLNADAFIKLFNDLPKWEESDGAEAILYSKETGVAEGNCTDFTQPASLKAAFDNAKDAKHWAMKKLNGVGFDEDI